MLVKYIIYLKLITHIYQIEYLLNEALRGDEKAARHIGLDALDIAEAKDCDKSYFCEDARVGML